MTLDEYYLIGETVTLGSHRFEPDEIKAFDVLVEAMDLLPGGDGSTAETPLP